MRILLTNDDGIYAEGIYAAYKALSKIADVTVVAPDNEQSSVGHGITLFYPLFAKKICPEKHFEGHAVSGKPADCVKFGVSVLLKGKKPDLIISGINWGGNDGCSVFYSGTVAGAREGALMGIKSFAISLNCFDDPQFDEASKFTAKLARWVHKNHLPVGTFFNVNVPVGKPKGTRFTRQGTDPIHEIFEKRKTPTARHYYWMSAKAPVYKNDNDVDTYALNNNYITITPIHCDMTNEDFLSTLALKKI
ncbi:MAG: 5'/3'-nucleotidase SurE [Candidatus Omnitrophica bacterium]|nr:5'/3'-nucleotidase SurE [Candidatus Omnitrophota bacterium]MDE2222699.1 5'/3'-nucleotidase SurE [Candidatus Omnitrophota bacterium]